MDLLNFTKEESQAIWSVVDKHVSQMRYDLYSKGIDVDCCQLYKAITQYFINQGESNRLEVRNWVLSVLYRCERGNKYHRMIDKVIEGSSIVGRIIKYRNEEDNASWYLKRMNTIL